MDPQVDAAPQIKRQRISQACDFCHKRGLKCVPPAPGPITIDSSSGNPDCLTCIKYGQLCTRLRQPKKRGTKPRPKSAKEKPSTELPTDDGKPGVATKTDSRVDSMNIPSRSKPQDTQVVESPTFELSPIRSDFAIPEAGSFKSRQNITALMDIYLDSIYPL